MKFHCMKKKYSKDLDELIALVSYLSMTKYNSMRPSILAKRLALNEKVVLRVLNEYKGIFRKSQKADKDSGECYYTLHFRYALRGAKDDIYDNDDNIQEILPAEHQTTLLNFIANRAVLEETQKTIKTQIMLTFFAAIIAAIAAIIAAFSSSCN